MSTSRSRLPDLCQCVWTRDHDAMMAAEPCLPYRVEPDAHDSLKAFYSCTDCGRRWPVWWNRAAAGWPEGWEDEAA